MYIWSLNNYILKLKVYIPLHNISSILFAKLKWIWSSFMMQPANVLTSVIILFNGYYDKDIAFHSGHSNMFYSENEIELKNECFIRCR